MVVMKTKRINNLTYFLFVDISFQNLKQKKIHLQYYVYRIYKKYFVVFNNKHFNMYAVMYLEIILPNKYFCGFIIS